MHKDDRVQMQLFTDNETADVSGAQNNVKTDQYEPGETENTDDEAIVDPTQSLNDLTGKEWLPETKSFFSSKRVLVLSIHTLRSNDNTLLHFPFKI